jgi:hypothetical protein
MMTLKEARKALNHPEFYNYEAQIRQLINKLTAESNSAKAF